MKKIYKYFKNNPQSQKEFISNTLQETDYFKDLADIDKNDALNYIDDKFNKSNKKFDEKYIRMLAEYDISVISDRYEMESYIVAQTIKKYREDNKN